MEEERYMLGYRHVDGSVEGFVGYASGSEGADQSAMRQIMETCKRLRVPFYPDRVIRTHDDVIPTDQKELQRQWEQITKPK